MKNICVFCGSANGRRPAYARAARAFGAELAGKGLGLVYGGGSIGLMGVVADAAMEGGASVVGVIPRALARREIPQLFGRLAVILELGRVMQDRDARSGGSAGAGR